MNLPYHIFLTASIGLLGLIVWTIATVPAACQATPENSLWLAQVSCYGVTMVVTLVAAGLVK